jgi:hypothetical protein
MNFWCKIKAGCQGLLPDCRTASRLQSEALDSALPATKRIGLWFHLLLCKLCRRYGQQIRFLRTTAHDHAEELTHATPSKLSTEARVRIKQRLHAEK